MGSLLKPKSTRARRGRSAQVPPGPPRKPTHSPKALAPRPRRRPAKVRNVAVGRPQATRDGALQKTLRQIQARLNQICSTAIVVAHALREQHVELDVDAADVLRGHVSDPLFEEILRLKRIVAGGAS